MKNTTIKEYANTLKGTKNVSTASFESAIGDFSEAIQQWGNYGGSKWVELDPEKVIPIVNYAIGAHAVLQIVKKKCVEGGIARYNADGKFEFIEPREDEYSFFFNVHFEDGEEIQTSFDSPDCSKDSRHHAFQEISNQYPEAEEIECTGCEKNYS